MEVVARLTMILVGFIIVMLGFITFIHSADHRILGLLICFAGVVSMFAGLPVPKTTLQDLMKVLKEIKNKWSLNLISK